MTKDVQIVEEAATEVVSNPSLSTTQKVLLGGAIVLTGGLVVLGIFLGRRFKARRAAKANADPEAEQTPDQKDA